MISKAYRQRLLPIRAVAVAAMWVLGCSSEPRAPVLRNELVYENDTEGFRFLTPEGWRQRARVNVPPGKLEKERLLVQYVRLSSEKGASLDVSMADLPATVDLSEYLAGPSGAVKSWRLARPIEPVEINGIRAERVMFTSRVKNEDTTKEVVVFRRGQRVYFFTAYFASTDARARDQVRRAVESTIWRR